LGFVCLFLYFGVSLQKFICRRQLTDCRVLGATAVWLGPRNWGCQKRWRWRIGIIWCGVVFADVSEFLLNMFCGGVNKSFNYLISELHFVSIIIKIFGFNFVFNI